MLNLILQRFVPLLTTLAMLLNSFGLGVVIPYNPERTEIVVSGNVTTDVDEILDAYNSAVKKTGMVIGKTSTDIIGTPSVSGDGSASDIAPFVTAFEDAETYIFKVPGNGEILESDVKSAKMSVKDGKKTIVIKIKDIKRTGTANDALSRAYGWTSTFDEAFSTLGMTVVSGDVTESYYDCVITCVIDEKSGKIIYGDWDATSEIVANDLCIRMLGVEVTIDMEYTATAYIDI